MLRNCVVAIIFIMVFSACVSTDEPPPASESVATQALVFITPTPTSTFVIPTATPTFTPQANLTAEALTLTPEPLEDQLLRRTSADLIAQFGFPEDSVELLLIESAIWGNIPTCNQREVSSIADGILGHRVWLLVVDAVYEYHTDDTRVILCDTVPALETEPQILMLVDPIAAESVTLAQGRVADELDISTRRVDLIDLELQEWDDSSLGCPVEGQTYTPATTFGYRIELEAGGNTYVFHATFDRVIRCEQD